MEGPRDTRMDEIDSPIHGENAPLSAVCKAVSSPLKTNAVLQDNAGAMIYLCSLAGALVNESVLPLEGGHYLQSVELKNL